MKKNETEVKEAKNLKNLNLILENSSILVRKKMPADLSHEFGFNTQELGIKNKTGIEDELKIKYLIYNDSVPGINKCSRCHKTPKHKHVGLQTLKILSVWTAYEEVLCKIDPTNENEIELLGGIIEVMRKHFFHGKHVCSFPLCNIDEEFKAVMKEQEPTDALNDVQEMYKVQAKNQAGR